MNFEIVLTVIVCFIAVLVIGLFVLWTVESRIEVRLARLRAPRERINGAEIVRDEVYLRIKEGKASVFYALPVAETEEIQEEAPAETVEVEAYDELAVSAEEEQDPDKLEQIERLADRYGGQITENSRIIEVSDPESSAFTERFAALDTDERARFNDFTAYLLAKPNVKMIQNKTNIVFKYMTERLLRIVIRRGVPVVLFQLVNTDLKRLVKEGDVKNIKMNTVDIRLASDEELSAAKQTADIALENAEQELAYRRERSKELRRQRARERRKSGDAVSDAE